MYNVPRNFPETSDAFILPNNVIRDSSLLYFHFFSQKIAEFNVIKLLIELVLDNFAEYLF